jgi:hypothetical protein
VGATNPVTSIATLLICAAFTVPAFAQEPTQPNLLLQLSQPAQPVPVDSITRDDIRDRPAPPRTGPLREPFRVYVGVGDPRCLPGEDGFGPGRIGGGTRRRSR